MGNVGSPLLKIQFLLQSPTIKYNENIILTMGDSIVFIVQLNMVCFRILNRLNERYTFFWNLRSLILFPKLITKKKTSQFD